MKDIIPAFDLDDFRPVYTGKSRRENKSQCPDDVGDGRTENSYGNNYIALSDEKGRALEELINTNVAMIYKSEPVLRYEKGVKNTIEGLFDSIYDATREIQNYCLNQKLRQLKRA